MNALHRVLYRIRPASLAAALKTLLRVAREEVTTPLGKFWIDPVSNFGQRVVSTEGYEPEVSRLVRTVVGPGDVFVDVGANEGYFSVLAALRGARALAVEPQARLRPVIERNARANGTASLVDIRQVGIGDAPGVAELHLASSLNSGGSSLFAVPRGSHNESVPIVTLDALLADAGVQRVRLLKIDCEGAERLVIPGARAALAAKRVDFISLEFHPTIIGEEACLAIGATLRGHGYGLKVLSDGLWVWHLPGVESALAPLGPLTTSDWPN